ncbi:MAG: amino acid adenylation domain-containing protein, partial [Desulfovibrionaceae bacterium]|nr:amino acid adenylation domain-containing protein [Desulfovibrionaceae bacterium]
MNEGDIVAVSFPRGADQICAVLAVLAAGAVYVPVSPGQPLPRRERICRKAGIHHALTTHDLAGSMPWPCGVMVLDLSLADSFAGPVPETPARPEPDQSAYIIFTSGSTGEPKGVDIAHEAACATIAAVNARFGIGGEDRALAVSAMDFDLSVYDVFGVLGAGGSLVLLDEDGRRNAQVWGRLLAEHHVTVWNSVPILLDMLLTSAESEGADLSSLRQVLLSGDWIGMDLPARLEQAAPGCGFAALGGATEAAIWSNVQDVTLPLPASWQSIPYGRPLAGQAYRAADCRGRDCPDWVPGELWIGGAGVARGYRGDPELTRKAFVAHGGARWYRTGDMGRFWPDGTIEFLGRRDFQVKVRGHRIELGEIEAAMRSFPGIRDAAVLVVSGASNRRLAAFMTAAGGAAIDTEALRAHLAGLLPDYMVPGAYVELAAMPLSANGKLDRKALAALPVPGGEEEGRTRPSTATERALAELWRTLLGAEEVFAEDTFFELGGDSLLATRLTAEIRSRFGRTLPLEELFLHPSLAGVAEAVDRLAAADSALPERNFPQLTPHPEDAHLPFPLTDIQHAYWIGRTAAYELGNVSSHIFFEFDETGLDAARLEQAWQAMIARHDMLRAVFLPDGTQKILPVAEARSGFAVEDLRGLPAAEADARAAAIRERMAGQVLPAETGPLHEIRVVLLDGEPAPAGSDAADSPDGPDSPAAKKTRARL